MTPGRNDPCPCGGGKKYKHCCLRAHAAVPPEEVTWRRVRRAIDDLGHRILNVATAHFGPTGEGIAVIDGCGPTVIPPRYKPGIIELRKDIPALRELFGAERLREYQLDLFELYHDITDQVLNPRPPALANTDGEPLQFQQLLYDIDAPREVFEKLKDLAAGASEEETAEAAEFDVAGKLIRAEIQWRRLGNAMHSSWENTILGTLAIEGGRLTAEVNSAERAGKLRAIIEERLGDRARFRTAKIESARSIMERAGGSARDPKAEARRAEHDRLAELPEVKALLAERLRAHYRGWVDEEIPALGGRTPREAVRDPDGREAVEALIIDIERSGETMRPPLDPAIVRELRETLGLPAGSP